MSEQTTNHEFRAETRKVLNILTHSLYSNREIFLRELISNATDALDKLRFLQSQTQHEAIRDADLPLEIRISSDKVQNCLTITDTGIGMTRDEMIENLGTIAHSGSEAFLKEHTQTAEDGTTSDASNIIGRFGIGFYSVFMVADKVEVTSLSATGDGPAYRWISDGTGTFTVEEAPDQADIKRGTTIRAFIKEGDKEFLEKYRIEGIIRTHSSFIPFPILVDGERVNTTPALWREPKFSIKKEQYDEFYKFLTYDQKDPLDVLHLSVDAPVQFNALLFIPDITKDYFGAYREHWGLELYALTSLDDYISRARESQKEIWYVAAPSREAAKVNPHSEVFRRKGLEVLYLYEPVDEFALETLAKYKDYTFKAVEHADSAVLDAFADTDEQPKAAPLSNEDMNEFDKLLETIRKVLGDQIKDARVSHRLADSPACLVSPDDGVTSSMERLMRVMQKDDSIPQKIFEINRDHPLLRTMLKLSKADPDDPQLAEMIQSLFDSTLLLDGYIKDPHALASRATKLLEQASAWYADVKKL